MLLLLNITIYLRWGLGLLNVLTRFLSGPLARLYLVVHCRAIGWHFKHCALWDNGVIGLTMCQLCYTGIGPTFAMRLAWLYGFRHFFAQRYRVLIVVAG